MPGYSPDACWYHCLRCEWAGKNVKFSSESLVLGHLNGAHGISPEKAERGRDFVAGGAELASCLGLTAEVDEIEVGWFASCLASIETVDDFLTDCGVRLSG
jgi:hypothetical protein